MRPVLTAVIAAIEACAVALAGLVVVVIPAFAMWLVSFDLEPDPAMVFGVSVSIWLLAHFIPLEFHIGPEAALEYGLPPESVDFTISLAPLGLTLLTLLLAMRAGHRFARDGGGGAAGVAGGTVGFAVAAVVLSPFALALEGASVWRILGVAAAVYGAGSLTAFMVRAVRDQHEWWGRTLRWIDRQLRRIRRAGFADVRTPAWEVLRLACASLAILVAAAAVGIASAIIAGYIEITTLTQGLQLDLLGVIVLFLGQLAFIPTACVWAIAWLSGSGFALGAGSSVSPFDALTGPLPSVPLLGALPESWGGAAILAPALVVVLAIGLGVLAARLTGLRESGLAVLVLVPLLAAALTGLAVAGLSALATGSIGPDRLGMVGPDPWVVGGLIAAEVAAGLLLGVLAGRIDRKRLTGFFHALDRPADPVAESTYLKVSRSPSRERLFRSARRARREASGSEDVSMVATPAETAEFSGTAEITETAEQHDQAATVPIHDIDLPPVVREDTSAEGSIETDPADDDTGPAVDDTEARQGEADAADPTELTPEEEEELLRAYSWDGAEPSSEPTRPVWRLPGRKR